MTRRLPVLEVLRFSDPVECCGFSTLLSNLNRCAGCLAVEDVRVEIYVVRPDYRARYRVNANLLEKTDIFKGSKYPSAPHDALGEIKPGSDAIFKSQLQQIPIDIGNVRDSWKHISFLF